jgi:hypothetical protein
MKYTYDNWLKGEFNYDNSLLRLGALSIDDFNLILDKSYHLVLEEGKAEFNRLKLNFERTVSEGETMKRESFSKEGFIKLEDDHYNLLLNKVPPEGKGHLQFNLSKYNKFTKYDVELIRSVQKYHSMLIEGRINLVISNPTTEQFNHNTGSDYSAASLAIAWRMYRNYLHSLKPQQSISSETKITLVENPHPTIFKNGHAYSMFLELKELTVGRFVVADYAFIYNKMKDKKLKAINDIVTEPIFIKFLNEEYKTEIHVIKLPFKNQQNKQQLYKTILDKYEGNILK